MAAPAISVLMPVHNGESFLAESIESVLSQSLRDLELVVVDDGSTDSTREILARFAARDPRVRIHRRQNGGIPVALNSGIELCRAPLVARLDADDLALPDRLRVQWRFLAQHPEVGVVGGQAQIIDDDGRRLADAAYPCDDAAIRRQMEKSTPFVHSAVTLRTDVLRAVGGYRHGFEGAADLDLWLRIGERSKLANLPEPVVSYRIHRGQFSARRTELQAIRALAARESARSRAAGIPDDLDDAGLIDEHTLLSRGVPREQIDHSVVDSALWMAKSADRAGDVETAAELFAVAGDRVRQAAERGWLRSQVLRAKAQRHREMGRTVRARALNLAARILARR